jgi:hypothetical protein
LKLALFAASRVSALYARPEKKRGSNVPAPLTEAHKCMRRIRTEVVIETTEVYIIKHRRSFIRTFCEECGREVSLVPPSEAALLTFQKPEAIYLLMNEKRVHFRFFATDETPFICLASLCLI